MDYRFDFTDEIGDKVITVPCGVYPSMYFDNNWARQLPDYNVTSGHAFFVHSDGSLENIVPAGEIASFLFSPYLQNYASWPKTYYKTLNEEGNIRYLVRLTAIKRVSLVDIPIASKQIFITVQFRNINEYDVYTGTAYKQ